MNQAGRIGFVLLWVGFLAETTNTLLGLGYDIWVPLNEGRSVLGSLVERYGYLTVLINEWIFLVLLAEVSRWKPLQAFRSPLMHASAAACILIVMLYHHFVLSDGQWQKQGVDFVTNLLGHYLVPIVYIAWWISTLPSNELRWSKLPLLLIPAMIYPVYLLIRGAIVNDYPYSAIDVSQKGYPAVLTYMVAIIVIFGVFCALTLLTNSLARRLTGTSAG